ncbi:MAG: hypothetical protein RLZZ157_653, partial [Pseudomonadota bacterium]
MRHPEFGAMRSRGEGWKARAQQRIDGAHGVDFTAHGVSGLFLRVPAIDIQMRPDGVIASRFDEFGNEECAIDGTRKWPAGIFYVGDVAVQIILIRPPQGQAPQGITGVLGRVAEISGKCLIIGEEGWKFGTKGDARRTCQSRKIEDKGIAVFACAGDGISEDQAALGVGVVDLNPQAIASSDDVAGAKRLP